jgi:hypothetical protein
LREKLSSYKISNTPLPKIKKQEYLLPVVSEQCEKIPDDKNSHMV